MFVHQLEIDFKRV